MPITKVKKNDDGSRTVIGPCTDDCLDRDGQRVDKNWARKNIPKWFDAAANIRNQHAGNFPPAGAGQKVEWKNGIPVLTSKIVEKTAIDLLDLGVYTGYSLGLFDPCIYVDSTAPNGRIGNADDPNDTTWLGEISLVDVPACPTAILSMVRKSARSAPFEEINRVELGGPDGSRVPMRQNHIFKLAKAFNTAGASGFSAALRKVIEAESPKAPEVDQAKALAASQWYGLFKRDMDPDVGGGVDRDKLDASDFVFPDTRTFPVVTPGDVSDAVSSWGRYKGSESFESFKDKLTALANRKGPSFVAALPTKWTKPKKGKTKMTVEDATKAKKPAPKADAPKADDKPEAKGPQCGTCKGSGKIMDGNRDCPKCGGSGTMKAEAKSDKVADDPLHRAAQAAGAAVTASIESALFKNGDDPDDEVADAIEEALEDLSDAADAQGDDDDEGEDKPTDDVVDDLLGVAGHAVSAVAAAQAADMAADTLTGKAARKVAKKMKKAKKKAMPPEMDAGEETVTKGKRKMPPMPDGASADGLPKPAKMPESKDGYGHETPMAVKPKKAKKAKASKAATPDFDALRIHDLLCPAQPLDAVKTAHATGDLPVPELINPAFFATRLNALTSGATKSRPDSVGEAYQAFASANKLSGLTLPDFETMRAAASKMFQDSYPTVARMKPGMIDPEDFRRGFLPSANDETSDTMRVPTPDLKPEMTAAGHDRGPLTDNQARPTLSGGESVAKSAKKEAKRMMKLAKKIGKQGSRVFYSNADKDTATSAAAFIHDHLAAQHPGICPMEAVMPGSDIDSDGLMGSPAEMNAKGPDVKPFPSPQGAGGAGMLHPVKAAKGDLTKGAEDAPVNREAIETMIATQTKAATAPLSKALAKSKADQRKLRKALKASQVETRKALRLPDPRRNTFRGPVNFRDLKAVAVPEGEEAAQKAAIAKTRVASIQTRIADRNSVTAGSAVEALRDMTSTEEFARRMVAD